MLRRIGAGGATLASGLYASAAFAQEGAETPDGVGGLVGRLIDGFNNAVFATIDIAGTPVELIVLWLATPMVLMTFYFGFINLRGFKVAWQVVTGKFADPSAPGEVSQFQALTTALSGTVGLGNIAGVAIAIGMGGPGAAFWMAVIGLFAMSLKFTEVSLSVKYRRIAPDGTVSGGPMYYLSRGLAARGWRKTGLVLGWSYAVFALPSLLQIAQVNQAYSQINLVTGFSSPWIFGIVIGIATAIVIVGGIGGIARVTSKLVPLMAAVYLGGAFFILISNASALPGAIGLIIEEAFSPRAAAAGSILAVFVIGMRRAVYSTEAGIGSATIAHAAAKTHEPISEGMVALMEPFIDTVVICSITALVIVVTGVYADTSLTDIQMTSAAFNSVISGFDIVLAVAVLLFAFSTIVSWAYYTSKVWGFVFGESALSIRTFQIIYCCALVPGAVLSMQQVFDIMDSIFFLMAVPNVLGIYLMAGELKGDLRSYLSRLKNGDIPLAPKAPKG
ncbi:MAG: alanine/glycine:cation symporter family protein [Pseudomonadota bacterium]